MKKTLIAIIAALLIAAIAGSCLAYNPDYVVVTGGSVYVRNRPCLEGRDLGTLHRGDTPIFAGDRRDDYRGVTWYRIYFRGGTGWISSRYSELVTQWDNR